MRRIIVEKPIYPSKYMRITQGYNMGSHIDSYAIDEAGNDSEISTMNAPFTGVIKKIYPQDANEVWLESIEPVEYPDGTIDYMTIMFAHSNDVSNLFVGKRINQNEPFYTEGTKGQATGNHCHLECGKGKFTGTGWYKNAGGSFSINNKKKPEECLWIDDTITIINSGNLNFKKLAKKEEETKELENNKNQENQQLDNKKLIFISPKKDLYGIYLEAQDKLYIER
jgi:hypothetical protein